MFSLTDEISKFEKCTYSLKDDTMTIDERFLGGGVTMNDLLQENNFIITEMRKMKNVFLNYCKLNEKVYKTITEHEISAADQLNKMITLSSKAERSLQSTQEEVKKTKKQIVQNNLKSANRLEGIVNSLKEEVEQKVDKKQFPEKVKILIEEYEQQEQNVSKVQSESPFMSAQETAQEKNVGEQKPAEAPKGKKKKGLTAEDIELLKSQLIPLIEEVSQKYDKHDKILIEKTSLIESLDKNLKKSAKDIELSKEQIRKTEQKLEKLSKQNKEQTHKIMIQLKDKTSDKFWENKLTKFNETYVKKPMDKLQQETKKQIQIINKETEKIHKNISQLKKQLEQQRKDKKQIYKKLVIIGKNLQKIEQTQNEMKNQYTSMVEKSQGKMIQITNEIKEKQKQNSFTTSTKLLQFQQKLQNLSQYIEEAVLRRVQIRFGKQLKEIRADIVQLNKKTQNLQINLTTNGEQVIHVKDVVAKKANFTDLIHLVDAKADKKSVKQIKEILSTPKLQMKRTIQEIKEEKTAVKTKRKPSSYHRIKNTSTSRPEIAGRSYYIFDQGKELEKIKTGKKTVRPTTANTMFLF